jgi:hypothetical protein
VDGEFIGLVAVVMLFGIPILGILSGPIKQAQAQRERREARKLYERLTMEKLDVIKTAVALGMNKNDLADLDLRLEQLIGADQMKSMLLQKDPHLPDADLDGMSRREARRARARANDID